MILMRDICASLWPWAYRVPQGAILFLTLFNIYMKPMSQVLRGVELHCVTNMQMKLHSTSFFFFKSDYQEAMEFLELVEV